MQLQASLGPESAAPELVFPQPACQRKALSESVTQAASLTETCQETSPAQRLAALEACLAAERPELEGFVVAAERER